MAGNNQVELVVTVEVDKANASIKSVNTNLSSIEQTAAKTTRAASQGIDGMTAAMVKGATAGNLLADAIKKAVQWAKEWTIDAAKDAAQVARMESATRALAKAHGINAQALEASVEAVQKVGFENEDALRTINRLIVADLDLSKAEGLAKLAKDAAALEENLGAAEALEKVVQAIEFGNARALRSVGLRLDFEREIQIAELKLGKTLSENEKVQVRYNAVMREAAKIQGAGAAASQEAESQMKALGREVKDLREEIGARFQDEFKAVIGHLRDMVKWLRENTGLLEKFAQVALMVAGVLATQQLAGKIMELAKAIAALRLASLNPYALLATGVLAAGAIVYKQYRDTQEQMQERYGEMERQTLRQDVLSGKTQVGDLRQKGMTDDQIRELISGRRLLPGEEPFQYGGPKIAIGSGNEPELDALKRAAEMRKHQAKVEQEAIQSAAEASAKAQPGFAREFAEMNAKIRKWTTFTDDKGVEHQVALTKRAWNAIIEELSVKWQAYKKDALEKNREVLRDYLKDEEEAARQRMAREAELYRARLQYNEEVARKNMEHLDQMLQVEQQRAGFDRDARLQALEAVDARTLEQKVWVEQQKAQIEIGYLGRVHEIKQRLFDLETSQRALDYELEMKRLGYKAGEIQQRIAEYTEQRDQIRQANQEATDAAVDAARQSAANRTAGMIRDHNQRIFDSLKRQAEGVFDALVSKSQSVWSAIGNSFKTAMLTAIKEVVTSQVARMLMGLFGGGRGYAPAGASGGGGWASVLGGIGIFGGGGGAPGGTPPFILSTGVASGSGNWNLASMGAGYKNWLTNLGNIGFRPERWRMDEFGNMTKLAGARGVGGWQGGALLAGGGILAMEGLRRGGWSGVGMTTAGGALIGAKFGGPIGAAIGGAIGFAAGIGRLFVKGAEQKVRNKIKAVYGVDISDKAILRQIVETAKSGFGGNLDVAIQSQTVRELVELYGLTTGQPFKGVSTQVRSVSIVQSGGSLYQAPGYSNGTALSSLGGLPALDSIGKGAPSGGQTVINITVPGAKEFFEKETVRVVVENPRAVQSAAMSATKQNAGRREMASLQMSPGLLTA